MRIILLLLRASICLAAVLRNIQVAQPPDLRGLTSLCHVPLIHHTFANSYGLPVRLLYEPNLLCGPPDQWQRLVLNLTATSNGTQYDRLATLYLGHVEILRTSTAEPTRSGIIWTVLKDVTHYVPLFSRKGHMLLDLGNLIDPAHNLTGEFDVRLSLGIYGHPQVTHIGSWEGVSIQPISTSSLDQANYFDSSGSTEVHVPHNAVEAYAEIYVSGNAKEEFWYQNAPDETLPFFANDTDMIGKGPYREVQFWVDDCLAGVVVPFPVIYTGGILATAWRPVASYGAFDAPTYVLDVTPFLPLLCNDGLHTVTLKTVGHTGDTTSINSNWWVSGNMRFVTDSAQRERTRGRIIMRQAPANPDVTVVAEVGDTSIFARTTVERSIRLVALLITRKGEQLVETKQNIRFTNRQRYSKDAALQRAWQNILTDSSSLHDENLATADKAAYLFSSNSNWTASSRRFDATIDQTYSRRQHLPGTAFPGFRPQNMWTQLSADGHLYLNETTGRIANGTGETQQTFFYDWLDRPPKERGPAYWRHIVAKAGNLVYDSSGGLLTQAKSARNVQPSTAELIGSKTGTPDWLPSRWMRRLPRGV